MRDRVRVLIIDDEPQFRLNTAAILKRRGFDAVAVECGAEALEQVRKTAYDVAVLDLKMPDMNGNEVLRQIKKIRPELEVILLTGYGTMASAHDALRAGAFDYLTKPCDLDLLAGRIHDAYFKEKGFPQLERRARDVMVPLDSFSTIHEDGTVADAIRIILQSFHQAMRTPMHRTVHRSILVLNGRNDVIGVLSLADLLRGFQSALAPLSAKSDATGRAGSPMALGCSGMFAVMAREISRRKVRELMSKAPPTIDAGADLMECAACLVAHNVPRLLVVEEDKSVGVLREQDLFFETAQILGALTEEERSTGHPA